LLKFDEAETTAGIYGFNSTLVGIATLFFFQLGAASLFLGLLGCVAAALLTRLVRRHVPFPTYTAPFIVVTWVVFFLGTALGAARVDHSGPVAVGVLEASANGVGQVKFQGNNATGLLFLVGIALSDWRHAAWVLAGSIVGGLAGSFHATAAARVLDPESLVVRGLLETVSLGLYGYNATLAAVALFLWRRSFIPPLLGMLFSVPLTELIPRLGIPALTAPFVLATWIVLAFGWLDQRFLRGPSASAP
jgi:urea transporter